MYNHEEIIKESKRIEEDSQYSAKGHYAAASVWGNVNSWLGGVSVILSAIAGTSALKQFPYHYYIAGILSIIVTVLTAILTFINPNQKATLHLKAANKYKALNNDVRIFYNITLKDITATKAKEELYSFNSRRNQLNLDSIQIPWWAFKIGRKGIGKGEANYQVDAK